MAINAITKLSFEWYEPEREEKQDESNELPVIDENNISGFKIRPLTGSEFMEVIHDQGSEGFRKAVVYALKDWRNFGEDEKFTTQTALTKIPGKYLMMIGRRIVEISDFNGEQQKNF